MATSAFQGHFQSKIITDMDKWLILDRDGVINEDSDAYIKSPDEWMPIPGSLEAIAELNRAAYKVVVITNQSGIARGLYSLDTLDKIHQKFERLLAEHGGNIERIYFCPHHPDDACNCRKPNPGMYEIFAKDYQLELNNVYAVGDSIRDIQAAQSAGAQAVLVRTGNGEQSAQTIVESGKLSQFKAVPVFSDLATFKDNLLS